MIILDTDHLSVLQSGSAGATALESRLVQATDHQIATTVITVDECLRGWMAGINAKPIEKQIVYYGKLGKLIAFFSHWRVQPFDEAAASRFIALRKQNKRVGTMDLKIAAICLTRDAILLSANLADFRQIPRVNVQDWIHDRP